MSKPRPTSTTANKLALPDTASKVPKVRQAGHLVDQKLKYNYPAKEE